MQIPWHKLGFKEPPVGYWPLGGGYGTLDLSPYANHGTLGDGSTESTFPTPVGSPTGGAHRFDGSDYIGGIGLESFDDSKTVAGWIKVEKGSGILSDSDENKIVTTNDPGFEATLLYIKKQNVFSFDVTDGSSAYRAQVDSTQFVEDEWIFIAGRADSFEGEVYIDLWSPTTGHVYDSTPVSGSIISGANIEMGRKYGNGDYFLGTIDEVMALPFALTASQVRDLYQVGSIAAWAAQQEMREMVSLAGAFGAGGIPWAQNSNQVIGGGVW